MANLQSWIGWGFYLVAKVVVMVIPVESVRVVLDEVVETMADGGDKLDGAVKMPRIGSHHH